MNLNFEDLFDFTASTGDWMSLIERLIFAIADFFKFLGIDLFAPDSNEETSGADENTPV